MMSETAICQMCGGSIERLPGKPWMHIGHTPRHPAVPKGQSNSPAEDTGNLGADTSWPLADVLTRLADAADHLLRDHDCDRQGWEGVTVARDKAREYAKALTTPSAEGEPTVDPTEADLNDPMFERVWQAIKGWDIQRAPGQGYAGATGTDVMTILRAVRGEGDTLGR